MAAATSPADAPADAPAPGPSAPPRVASTDPTVDGTLPKSGGSVDTPAMPSSDRAPPAATATAANAPETTAPPVPKEPGPIGLAEARALALGVPCALIDVSEIESSGNPNRYRVSGPAQPGTAFDSFLRQIRGSDLAVDVATDRLEPGQCPALAVIADRVRRSRAGNALHLIAPDAPVPVGNRMTLTVAAVVDGALYIDLFAADGSVQHLLRRIVPPGSNGSDVAVAALVTGPPGQGLLVAFATPVPLNLQQRPATENASAYLPVLRGELARKAPGGSEPRAEIAMVSIIPGPRPAAVATMPASTRSRLPGLNDARCADILARFQLGEALSDADRSVLQSSCGR